MQPVLSNTNVLVSQEDRWEICDTLDGELGMDSQSPIQWDWICPVAVNAGRAQS